MTSRRAFLQAIGPAAAAIVVVSKPAMSEEKDSGEDICRSLAARLAREMQKRHGGHWHSEINHELGAAYVFKSF